MTRTQRFLADCAWEWHVKCCYMESLGCEMPINGALTAYPPHVRRYGVAVLREVAARRMDIVYAATRGRGKRRKAVAA
jgi:hypothetical protein